MAKPTGARVRLFDFTIPAQSEAMTGFPLLLPTPGATSDFWSLVAANGADIHVYDAIWNELPYEIAAIDKNAKTIQLWTKASLSNTVATVLHYGCSGVNAVNTPSNVWTQNYVIASHCGESSGNIGNSAPTSYVGAAANLSYAQTGKIGRAVSFNGVSSKIDYGDVTELTGAAQFTWAGWLNVSSYGNFRAWWSKGSHGAHDMYTDDSARMTIYAGSANTSTQNGLYTAITNALGAWHHWAVTYNSSLTPRMRLRIDGVNQAMSSNAGTPFGAAGSPLVMGFVTGWTQWFSGLMDEIHWRTDYTTTAWAAAQYNNQNNPSTWGTLSAEYKSVLSARTTGLNVGIGFWP